MKEPSVFTLSQVQAVRLFFELLPYYIQHLLFSPHCQDVPEIGYKCQQISLLDFRFYNRRILYHVVRHMLLDGYTEITGLRLKPETGKLFFFAIELTIIFDECLERKIATKSGGSFSQILSDTLVQKRKNDFIQYLALFGHEKDVIVHLQSRFEDYYNTYIELLTNTNLNFQMIYKAAQLDNGLWLRSLIEILCIFNEHKFNNSALEDFYNFGMSGKFIDDMVDIKRDVAQKCPNLLYSLIKENKKEMQIFENATNNNVKINHKWWTDFCPQTSKIYFGYLESHAKKINSSKMKSALQLIKIPVLLGYDYDIHKQSTIEKV